MDQDEPRETAKMSTKSLMAGEHWEIFLLLRKHYDSLKQNLKRKVSGPHFDHPYVTAFISSNSFLSLCVCMHIFTYLTVWCI